MKTIFTGILFRLFLKRRLTFIQWLALVTLACGTATSQLPSGRARRSHVIATGAALSMVSCLLSALGGAQPPVVHAALPSARPTRRLSHFLHPPRAGIYSERLLKDRASASIHWQNMQLYVWGVGFNALGAYIKKSDAPAADAGLLTGFGTAACIVVACNAFNGLAISAVLKCARSRRDCSRRDAAAVPLGRAVATSSIALAGARAAGTPTTSRASTRTRSQCASRWSCRSSSSTRPSHRSYSLRSCSSRPRRSSTTRPRGGCGPMPMASVPGESSSCAALPSRRRALECSRRPTTRSRT